MPPYRDVQKIVETITSANSPALLALTLREVTQDIGFDFFAIIQHVDLSGAERSLAPMNVGTVVALSNYPEQWSRTYVNESLVFCDPVVLACRRTTKSFRWDDLDRLVPGKATADFLARARSVAGIDAGFTIPCLFPNEPAGSANFATRSGTPFPESSLQMAESIGQAAFRTARRLVLKARQAKQTAPALRLTNRQLQCTVLAGRGLTESEIALRLGIGTETVKCHLRDARAAYDVAKTVQLIVILLAHGHISVRDLAYERPHSCRRNRRFAR